MSLPNALGTFSQQYQDTTAIATSLIKSTHSQLTNFALTLAYTNNYTAALAEDVFSNLLKEKDNIGSASSGHEEINYSSIVVDFQVSDGLFLSVRYHRPNC